MNVKDRTGGINYDDLDCSLYEAPLRRLQQQGHFYPSITLRALGMCIKMIKMIKMDEIAKYSHQIPSQMHSIYLKRLDCAVVNQS